MTSGFESDLVDALKEVVKGSNWQNIGNIENLKRQKCRRLYADDGEDMVLICLNGGKQIYAMDASCPHEGQSSSGLKVRLTHEVGEKWRNKEITKTGYAPPPSQPKRDPLLNASRISNLHSMANIEQWAIDLSWDIIARFSMEKVAGAGLPKEFFDDFVQVACEEAKDCGILLRTRQIVY
ncbi:hypothetical protein KUTeg_010734 [Tegillarca granosa]|uniref:Rieske domain-containing protein n=1 Tax=Tegillarca granosa TaxID=220873 RepID=A0ABQ9F1V1_TEGGR|nr:hypothetical protein KUTeg_010734 [Tegillarca granosa]